MYKGFILLNCDLGAEEYIVDEIRQMDHVSNAYITFGAYDTIAEIQTDDQDEFERDDCRDQAALQGAEHDDAKRDYSGVSGIIPYPMAGRQQI